MTWASRNCDVLCDEAMELISKEIDTSSRDLVWLTFTVQDLSLDPQPSYFFPDDTHLRDRNVAGKKMRVDVPVPKGVKADHIRHLIHSIIRDGYDFHAIVYHPGR